MYAIKKKNNSFNMSKAEFLIKGIIIPMLAIIILTMGLILGVLSGYLINLPENNVDMISTQLETLKTKLESLEMLEDKLNKEFDFDTKMTYVLSGIVWMDARSVNLGYLYINKDLAMSWYNAKQYCEATQVNGHLLGMISFQIRSFSQKIQ